MLFTLASTFAFSELNAASPGTWGPGLVTPSMRPPARARLADPFAAPTVPLAAPFDPAAADPVELAVPAALVPGAVGTFAELPTPLGSLTALFSPPALAEPPRTAPLTA